MSRLFKAFEWTKQRLHEDLNDSEPKQFPTLLLEHPDPEPLTVPAMAPVIDEHVVSLTAPTSIEADQYRTIRNVIEGKAPKGATYVVGISSPTVGDGKTLTAINLAGALAQAEIARVLLVDADLRAPSVARFLGFSAGRSPGLVEAV